MFPSSLEGVSWTLQKSPTQIRVMTSCGKLHERRGSSERLNGITSSTEQQMMQRVKEMKQCVCVTVLNCSKLFRLTFKPLIHNHVEFQVSHTCLDVCGSCSMDEMFL